MLWVVGYGALAVLVILRGLVPMWKTWRATAPRFTALPLHPADRLWSTEECAELERRGLTDVGYLELHAGRRRRQVDVWVSEGPAAVLVLAESTSPRRGKGGQRRTVATFLLNGVGWLETSTVQDRPLLPGQILQVVPGASVAERLDAHRAGVQHLGHHGVSAGSVVRMVGLDALRHHMLVARSQMRRHPVGWFAGTLLTNVAPVRTTALSPDEDPGSRLVKAGLRPH